MNKYFSKKLIFGCTCSIFVVFMMFALMDGFYGFSKSVKDYKALSIDAISQRMRSLFFEINIFPGNAGNDILFLSQLSSLDEVTNSDSKKSKDNAIKNLRNDFLGFLKENTAYYQLRYIDENGDEIVRVEFDGNNYKIFSKNELQNKKGRYYFTKTMILNKKEVFISPLDLNMENGKLENRGSKDAPKYVPVIRYATPVFDDNKRAKGIIVSNIYADYFLEDIRRAHREGEKMFLINEQGYYLANPQREKEYAFVFGNDYNFYSDYPEISKEVVSDFKRRIFETDEFIFSLWHIYPTSSSFEAYRGSEKVFGKNADDLQSWIFVSVSSKTEMNKIMKGMKGNYLSRLLLLGALSLLVGFLIFVFIFKSKE